MDTLLCRNRVRNYAKWREVFDSHAAAHREAGLVLERIWQASDDPNEIYFLFAVEDRAMAEAFMNAPEAAQAGEASGVLEGEARFLSSATPYAALDVDP